MWKRLRFQLKWRQGGCTSYYNLNECGGVVCPHVSHNALSNEHIKHLYHSICSSVKRSPRSVDVVGVVREPSWPQVIIYNAFLSFVCHELEDSRG